MEVLKHDDDDVVINEEDEKQIDEAVVIYLDT
jgi:hypothetical protein